MAKHIFKHEVHHNKTKFTKDMLCPQDLVDMMSKLNVLSVLPEPVAPIEPPKAEPPKKDAPIEPPKAEPPKKDAK